MHCRPRLTTLLVHHVDHACFASMSRGFCTGVVDNNKNAQACKLQLRTRFGFCFYIGASIRICYDEGEHRGTEGERLAEKRERRSVRLREEEKAPKMVSTLSKKSHSIRALPLRLFLSRTCLYFERWRILPTFHRAKYTDLQRLDT